MGLFTRNSDRRNQQRRRRSGRRVADGRDEAIKARVLVIEPHDDTRMLYVMLLEEAGYTVYAVANGIDAVSVAQKGLPDLVILELAVPRVDGFGILQAIRQNASTADIPAVVVTGALHYDMIHTVGSVSTSAMSALSIDGPDFTCSRVSATRTRRASASTVASAVVAISTVLPPIQLLVSTTR